MQDALAIVEIISRSDQGVTRPFLCRCEDDKLYYVKGRNAGPRSLLCEWLAGHLAQALGLPVPPFAIVQASRDLLALYPEGNELGSLPAFGSCVAAAAQELTISHLNQVDNAAQRDVAVFDWWVRNQDRTLTTNSGNPNLLWDAARHKLVVIDHNVAFDPNFSARTFFDTHVFAHALLAVLDDFVERSVFAERLSCALEVWPQACNNAPAAWWFADNEQTVPTAFDPVTALAVLNRCTKPHFWSRIS